MRATLIAGFAAICGAALGASATYFATDREMDVKMVEIAVGILSQEPEDNIAPAREWAVDVIDHYAQVRLTPAVRAALVENRAITTGTWGAIETQGTWGVAAPDTAAP